jgi:hypothetical protein
MVKIGDKIKVKIPTVVRHDMRTKKMKELEGREGIVEQVTYDWTSDSILVYVNGFDGALYTSWVEKIEDENNNKDE